MTTYRPCPGKPTLDPQNRVVTVKRYGTDSVGEYVEVQLAGSYGSLVRLPVSCIRPLTSTDYAESAAPTDAIIALLRRKEDEESLTLRVVKARKRS